jgi:hypothetical protein
MNRILKITIVLVNHWLRWIYTALNAGAKESIKIASCRLVYSAVLRFKENTFTRTYQVTSGDHWAVGLEIFWKARGDHLQISKAAIACVFKKFIRRLPDGRPQVQKVASNGGAPINQARNFDVIGYRQSFPKLRCVTRMPGGAWRRLYSLILMRRVTRSTSALG